MNKSDALDRLHVVLTYSHEVAVSLGDALLVYLVDMALCHVRKTAINLEKDDDNTCQEVPLYTQPMECSN